jgi:SH3-like domain-containing protein
MCEQPLNLHRRNISKCHSGTSEQNSGQIYVKIFVLRSSTVAASLVSFCLCLSFVAATPSSALAQTPAQSTVQSDEDASADTVPPPILKSARGAVTNLPLPRFVSLKATEANARRGPSLSHRIDWVFKLRGYPLEVVAEYGHWRRVRDYEDATGWVHYTLISGVRTALVQHETVDLHVRPDPASRLTAQAEKGAVLRLLECSIEWCKASGDGHKGWLRKTGLWGIGPDEILE